VNKRNLVLSLGCLVGLLAISARASASGFDFARFGSDRAHAASTSAFATYYNPAALAASPHKFQISGDFMLALHGASYDRTASTTPVPAGAQGANTGKSKLFDVIAGPALAASFRWKDFAGGLGAFAPMTGQQSWGGNGAFNGNTSYPGAQDGSARWHLIQGSQQSIYFTASAAYNLRKIGLSLGASANLVYNTVSAVRAATASLDDNLANEGRIDVNVKGLVGSFGVGALWEVWRERLWLGLSYQSPPGGYNGMKLDGKVRTNFSGMPSSTKASLYQTLPDILRFALRYKDAKRRYELRLFGDFERWSLFKNQCASKRGTKCEVDEDGAPTGGALSKNIISAYPRNWHNAWGLHAGGNYWFTEAWEAFVTVGYDGNAIPLGMLEPSIMDGQQLSAQLGGRYYFGSRLALSLAYTQSYWLPRDSTGKSQLDQLQSPGKLPTADGKYEQWLGLFNAFVEVYFD
jgi:long-subunit fatty acid transport protein